jgi:predicted cupin superfamily sugar epimerase
MPNQFHESTGLAGTLAAGHGDPELPPDARVTVATLIRELRLEAHPEGGFFRETYRSRVVDANGRAAATLIYFLLPQGHVSRLHRIDADEGWHLYRGGPLEIYEFDEGAPQDALRVTALGTDLARGERPQHVVPAGRWFGAACASGADYALVGCSVAPGFEFSRFELGVRAQLEARFARHGALVRRLTVD